jgi:hypothetical protein
MSAREIYDTTIRQLSPIERLRLASFILDDLAATGGSGLDLRDDWSDEDMADLSKFSLQHAAGTIASEDTDG